MDGKELTAWIVGLLTAAIIVTAPVACTVNRHRVVAQAIEAGADPTEEKCAIEADTGNTTVCVIAAMRHRGGQ